LNLEAKGDFLKRGYYEASYLWNGNYIINQPDFCRNIHRLNLTIGFAVGKGKALRIGINGINLLDSGSDFSSSLSSSSLVRNWSPIPRRSFLFSLSYRFNNSNKRPLPTVSF